eukprot:141620_1
MQYMKKNKSRIIVGTAFIGTLCYCCKPDNITSTSTFETAKNVFNVIKQNKKQSAVAACSIIVCAGYYYLNRKSNKQSVTPGAAVDMYTPGGFLQTIEINSSLLQVEESKSNDNNRAISDCSTV